MLTPSVTYGFKIYYHDKVVYIFPPETEYHVSRSLKDEEIILLHWLFNEYFV